MKIILRNVRLAFPQLFEAKAVNGEGEPAFSASFILPKDHPQVAEINAAIDAVAKEKWGAKAPTILTAARNGDKVALHDGDAKADYDGFEGNFYVSARNKTRPLITNQRNEPVVAADGVPYAGCFVHASIELWAQDNSFGKRVNASLRGVMFHRDGDAFAGGGAAAPDEFADLAEGAHEAALA